MDSDPRSFPIASEPGGALDRIAPSATVVLFDEPVMLLDIAKPPKTADPATELPAACSRFFRVTPEDDGKPGVPWSRLEEDTILPAKEMLPNPGVSVLELLAISPGPGLIISSDEAPDVASALFEEFPLPNSVPVPVFPKGTCAGAITIDGA